LGIPAKLFTSLRSLLSKLGHAMGSDVDGDTGSDGGGTGGGGGSFGDGSTPLVPTGLTPTTALAGVNHEIPGLFGGTAAKNEFTPKGKKYPKTKEASIGSVLSKIFRGSSTPAHAAISVTKFKTTLAATPQLPSFHGHAKYVQRSDKGCRLMVKTSHINHLDHVGGLDINAVEIQAGTTFLPLIRMWDEDHPRHGHGGFHQVHDICLTVSSCITVFGSKVDDNGVPIAGTRIPLGEGCFNT